MARIVAAAGVPHTPVFPALVAAGGPAGQDVARRYAAVAEALGPSGVDLILLLTCDHLNAFFLDAWPTFAVAAAPTLTGPLDEVPTVPEYRLEVAAPAGRQLHRDLLGAGFDPALKLGGRVDHGVVVPLHLLGARPVPVLPVYVNGMVEPLPSAQRCRAFGQALARAVRALPEARVAVVASGSFSLEVGGPRIDPERFYGVPDPDWALEVVELLAAGSVADLVRRTTPARLAGAGTVAGELLPWIVMSQLLPGLQPAVVDHRAGEGHAFMAWC